ETVRMVLVEGHGAGGVTVEQEDFSVAGRAATDRVIAAILRTRQSAAERGYQLRSVGVMWIDRAQAATLRDALAVRHIDNVMLVSAFAAAATLARAVGSATDCARTALLFVEPGAATLAVVDSVNGSVADIRQQRLPRGDDAALAKLAAMVSTAEAVKSVTGGVFLVGSGVDVPAIKPALEAATALAVIGPEDPDTALARGAALAAANAQLGAAETVALSAQDLTAAIRERAQSAEADTQVRLPAGGARRSAVGPIRRRSRKSMLAVGAATAVVIGGAVALALELTVRPHVDQRPDSTNVVTPATQALPPKAPPPVPEAPAPPPPAGPPPAAPAPPRAAVPRRGPASASPAPGPVVHPPRQAPPPSPPPPLRSADQDGGTWIRRQLGRYGIPLPWP
ncbi:MAG: hypothetical protein PHQ28_11250, partial [Mycobacterium sp.]|nr:hypothetical protein [Mycobacterium sp.]